MLLEIRKTLAKPNQLGKKHFCLRWIIVNSPKYSKKWVEFQPGPMFPNAQMAL